LIVSKSSKGAQSVCTWSADSLHGQRWHAGPTTLRRTVQREVLAVQSRSFVRTEHRGTLTTRGNLASSLSVQGNIG